MSTASPTAPPSESPLETRTTRALWERSVAQGWTTPAYFEEGPDGWREISWSEAGERVDHLAQGLLARGVRKGDAVAVVSRTRLEWILLDWAIMSIGAVVVGLYPTNTASECAYILGHSEAVLAFVEDDVQREKLESVRGELPALREIVGFDELAEVRGEGREVEPVGEDDVATLIYTSGATGPPKGCMLTHKNLTTAAIRVKTHMEGTSDTVLLFLPMAHSFARICHQAAAYHGSTLALCSDVARVPEALQHVKPTILPAVPRVYEKIHANAVGEIERAGGAKRAIGRWALGVGARASARRRAGAAVPPLLRAQAAVDDKLDFSKVRERLGERLRLGVSAADPLGVDVLEFFSALNMLVMEGYVLTETSSSLIVNDPDDYRFGTVGHAVDGCQIK